MKNTKSIKTEYQGEFETTKLEEIQDYLFNIAEMSTGAEDFVKKTAYGLTDETSGFESNDQNSLKEWYNEIYRNA